MPITVVLFDADGVVQSTPADWLTSVAALAPAGANTDAFLADLFAAERPCAIGVGDFAAVLADVLARWGSAASIERALALWQWLDVHADVLAAVAALRRAGVRVGLATNQHAYRAAFMRDRLGYGDRFDSLFFSCELGVAKPDAAYFGALVERLGVPGDACLFIDDSAANVAAATAAGLRGECFRADEGVHRLGAILEKHGLSLSVGG